MYGLCTPEKHGANKDTAASFSKQPGVGKHQFNLCVYFAVQLIISKFLNAYFKQ